MFARRTSHRNVLLISDYSVVQQAATNPVALANRHGAERRNAAGNGGPVAGKYRCQEYPCSRSLRIFVASRRCVELRCTANYVIGFTLRVPSFYGYHCNAKNAIYQTCSHPFWQHFMKDHAYVLMPDQKDIRDSLNSGFADSCRFSRLFNGTRRTVHCLRLTDDSSSGVARANAKLVVHALVNSGRIGRFAFRQQTVWLLATRQQMLVSAFWVRNDTMRSMAE